MEKNRNIGLSECSDFQNFQKVKNRYNGLFDDMNIDNILYTEWVPSYPDYFKPKINTKLYETILQFTDGNIKVCSDEKSLIEKSKQYYKTDDTERFDGEVYFLTKQNSFTLPHVKHDRNRCTGLYNPIKHSLFIYALDNFGFMKSIVMGVLADLQQDTGLYALHAGIVKENGLVRAYVGPTEAGKTTHSLLGALKDCSEYLTDDWSVFDRSGITKHVDDNLMIRKEDNSSLGTNVNGTSQDKKKMLKTGQIIGQNKIKDKLKLDVGVLLIPKKINSDIVEISRDDFTDYVLKSTYHLPFNYFDTQGLAHYKEIWGHEFDKTIDEKLRDRIKFWDELYDSLHFVVGVSTRNKPPHITHGVIDEYISRRI